MKLKLVVATMGALGLLASYPVLAADNANSKHTRHTHHKMMKHTKMMKRETMERHDYKDMGALPVVEAACTISQTTMILDSTNQNIGRSMPNPCNPGWFNRLQISGGINVDAIKLGSRSAGYMGENYQRLSLNDAYLNVAATVNDWAKAFASISYNTATTVRNPNLIAVDADTIGTMPIGEYSAAYSNNINGGATTALQLEQAYVTLGNLDNSPIYTQIGKQYAAFSRYEIHPITRSMTQVLSETLATSAKIGFIVPAGFQGSLYVFDDPVGKIGHSSSPTNYGADLSFSQINDQLGWDIGASYLYNLIGANDTAYSVQNFTFGNGYNKRVGGIALYGDVNSGPFTLAARWTRALQRFSPLDLPQHGIADYTTYPLVPGTLSATASGAKPWAAGIQAGFGFDYWGKTQNVYVGYQASGEAAGLNLPKNRWVVGYGLDVWKYTNFGVEWDHDRNYSVANGGNNKKTNLVSLRAGVKFG